MSSPLDVSFVVVTMNRSGNLMKCLEGVEKQFGDFRKEIIVVDNDSEDDTLDRVRRQFPEARTVALGVNMGPAEGRNRGVAEAQGEICIFLDDDAVFHEAGAADRTLRYFRNFPEVACLNYKVRNALTRGHERKYRPRQDKAHVEKEQYAATFCGGACAIRRDVYVEQGGYWGPYFYSGEELDLAFRLLDSGHRVLSVNDILVDHFEVNISRPRGQYLYYNARNRPWVALRNLPYSYVVSYCLLWWGDILRRAFLSGQPSVALRGIYDSLRGFRKAWSSRNEISKETLDYLRIVSGRLRY